MVQVGRRQALPTSTGMWRSQYPSCTNEAKQRIGKKTQCLATMSFSLPPSTAGPVKAILPRYLDSNSFVLEIEAKYHSKKLPAFLFVRGGFFPLPRRRRRKSSVAERRQSIGSDCHAAGLSRTRRLPEIPGASGPAPVDDSGLRDVASVVVAVVVDARRVVEVASTRGSTREKV